MTKIFLLILLWHPDDSITHNIVTVDACPPKEIIASQFKPMVDMGLIKSWSGFCREMNFHFREELKQEQPKEKLEEKEKEEPKKKEGPEEKEKSGMSNA